MAQNGRMRERTREMAEREMQALKGKGYWLRDNLIFSNCYKLSNHQAIWNANNLLFRLLPKEIQHRKLDQKKYDINILCADLLLYDRYYKPVSISLSRNNYTGNNPKKCSLFLLELVHMLHDNKFIGLKIGYHKSRNDAWETRIWPTDMFLNYFHPIPLIDYEPIELVNLRNEDKEDIDYDDSEETIHIRNILRKANIVNRNALIGVQTRRGFEPINTDLHAVFSNSSFEQGGRLYTGREGYQSLKSGSGGRKDIIINGTITVELDFSGLHPRLLYALEGEQYDADPYNCFPVQLRKFSKCLLLALVNAKSIGRAVNYGYNERYEDYELLQALEDLDTDPSEMINVFCETHGTIAKYFGNEIGMKLMNIDSKIALDVVEHFTKCGIPILAIHDSFIVQGHLQEELKSVMQKAYKKHSGGFDCPIK